MNTAKITGFHHVASKVANFDAAVKFYKEALGFVEKIAWGEGNSRAIMLDAGDGNYVELFEGGDPSTASEARLLHFALRTPDCAAAHACALAHGATERMVPTTINIETAQGLVPVKIAFVISPSGEVIEFFENSLT